MRYGNDEYFKVVGILGGRALVCQPLLEVGEHHLGIDKGMKPAMHLVLDLGSDSPKQFKDTVVAHGPSFEVLYEKPTADEWQSPLQFAVLAGIEHVSGDTMQLVFAELSSSNPAFRSKPRSKRAQMHLLLTHFGRSLGNKTNNNKTIKHNNKL